MDKKKLLILIVAFVAVMAGAYAMYEKLGNDFDANQMTATEEQGTVEEAEEVNEQESAEATDAQESADEEVAQDGAEEAEETEEPEKILAPDFIAFDKDKNQVNLHDYLGKPIVLNFWASWCGPCRSEMGAFNEKYLELGEDVQFLMVNVTDGGRETFERASSFVKDNGYTFPVLYDLELSAANTYGAYSLPTTYFIDKDGYLVARAVGPIDGETLQAGVDMIVE